MKRLENVDRLLAAHPLLAVLSPQERRMVVHRGAILDFNPGELVYVSGTKAERVFLLLEGALQIELPPAGSKRGFAVALFPAPAVLGECQVLHERPWSGTGVALFPLTALALARGPLEALLQSHHRLALLFYRELAWRFLGTINQFRQQTQASPEERLARYVLAYARAASRCGATDPTLVTLPQLELARAAGLTRETVNRFLKGWEKRGYLQRPSRAAFRIEPTALEAALCTQSFEPLYRELNLGPMDTAPEPGGFDYSRRNE